MVSLAGSSIVAVIISLVILAILIYNVVYIGSVMKELESGGSSLNLSTTGAKIIFWVDIILIVFVFGYLLWNIYLMFTSHQQRGSHKEALLKSRAGTLATGEEGGAPAVEGAE